MILLSAFSPGCSCSSDGPTRGICDTLSLTGCGEACGAGSPCGAGLYCDDDGVCEADCTPAGGDPVVDPDPVPVGGVERGIHHPAGGR